MDYRDDSPPILRDYLTYHETIKGHSRATVDEYFLDLRNFFRFLKIERGLVPRTTELDDISILDVDLPFVSKVSLAEVYDYLAFLSRDKAKYTRARSEEYGLNAASRARKVSSIRGFYKYLTVKAKLLNENPIQDLDSPKAKRSLPRYLTLEESQRLLASVDGVHKERDYCILCIFLNCGLRDYMVERMNRIEGVSCIKPDGAFYVMMNIEKLIGRTLGGVEIRTADDFALAFLEKGLVAVVACDAFGIPNFIRWTYATSLENIREGLDRLEKFLRGE